MTVAPDYLDDAPSDILTRLSAHYRPFPGPTLAMYRLALRIWRQLDADDVCTHDDSSGIIAVAEAAGQRHRYTLFAFSATLNLAVRNRYGRNAARALSRGDNLIWCTALDQNITRAARFNPGCAEKRIMATARGVGARLTALYVVNYSFDTHPDDLGSHLVLATDRVAFFGPCDSCKLAYSIFFS